MNSSIVIYTMTSGLGDYLVMGDVMQKVEKLLPQVHCLMTHRRNPHVKLWPYGEHTEKFYDIYSLGEIYKLIHKLKRVKKTGAAVFGLQMAPGSLQGFFWYSFLKKMGVLDYIVDFNLINADIITPPEGNYILDWQLNQIKKLFKIEIPKDNYQLNLPVKIEQQTSDVKGNKIQIGIHPWSRRGKHPCFVWSFKNWGKVIEHLLRDENTEIIIFGRDVKFNEFKNIILADFDFAKERIRFFPSTSVPDLITTIQKLDLLISVNTAVVHAGYALHKKMVILNGPSLTFWIPKGPDIRSVSDQEAIWDGVDRYIPNTNFPTIERITPQDVINMINELLKTQKL